MMVLVYIDKDERWPDYSLYVEGGLGYFGPEAIEVDDALYERYAAAVAAYDAVQDEIAKIVGDE